MTRDPDLDQACEDLSIPVAQLAQIDGEIARSDPVSKYDELTALLVERADFRDQVRLRAERLNLAPRALVLIVEEASRLSKGRRKVVTAAVRSAIATTAERYRRDKLEAAADLIAARHGDVTASQRVSAADAAMAYLEASR